MKNKIIPTVIITSLVDNEYKEKWGLGKKGSWILRENESYILEFEELENVYGKYNKETGWEQFKEIQFKIPDKEIIALVLDGNTGDKSPHQFDILWHLLCREKCKIGHILIHPSAGNSLEVFSASNRLLKKPEGVIINYKSNNNLIKFECLNTAEEITHLEYSLVKKSMLKEWIKVISKAVRVGSMSCAVKRLKELKDLLDSSKYPNFKIKVIDSSPPKPCFVYEIISWLPNLFLDLFIDSRGLWEILNDSTLDSMEKDAEIRKYLKEIIKDKSEDHFRQKLADARYLAFGETYGKGTLKCNGDKSPGSVPKKPSESVENNFKNENLKEMLTRSDLKNTKDNLARHLGLIQTGGNLQEDPGHSTLKFLCALDCLIEKGLEHVDDDCIFFRIDFHQQFSDWYYQLVEISDKLKEQIR